MGLEGSAGGIRTHGLELMRLARTAAPLPRKSDRLGSNQRSPVPETGGVASSPTVRRRSRLVRASGSVEGSWGTRRFTQHGSHRSRYLRRESNPHFRIESPASSPFDHGGTRVDGPGVEPGVTGVSDRCVPTLARRRQVSPGGIEPPSSTLARWRSSAELRRVDGASRSRTSIPWVQATCVGR